MVTVGRVAGRGVSVGFLAPSDFQDPDEQAKTLKIKKSINGYPSCLHLSLSDSDHVEVLKCLKIQNIENFMHIIVVVILSRPSTKTDNLDTNKPLVK